MKLRHLFVLGMGLLLVGCSTPAPLPLTQLAVISLGATDAAMGLRAVPIRLGNCGTSPLTVNGYPALRVLDDDHRPVDVKVVDGADSVALVPNLERPPTTFTLAPGRQAEATVLWKNTVTDSTVVATSGTYFDVAAASGQPWQTRKPDGPIDLGNTGKLGVSPWVVSPDQAKCQVAG